MRRPPAPKGYKPVERGEPIEVGYLYRSKNIWEKVWLPVEDAQRSSVFFTSRIHTDLWFCKPVEAPRA